MLRNKAAEAEARWTARWPLTYRIMAVNVFAIAILAGSLLYLDSFRARITADRAEQTLTQVQIMAVAANAAEPQNLRPLLRQLGEQSAARLRIYSPDGDKLIDSWNGAPHTYQLRDPVKEPWTKDIARILDRILNAAVGGELPPRYEPPVDDRMAAWPEVSEAAAAGSALRLREAPDGTPFISAAARLENGDILLLTSNPRALRAAVRSERLTLGIILLGTILLSALLSLFLARTIVLPLRRLARAAQRVRLGRAREVSVPRLPERKDEIGLLARAIHDMTQSLRARIDATEAFAADVTHELKNPLASLRSAVDSLERVEDPVLRRQLLDVVRSDVQRLDRLVVDIAETSRLDAELSRAPFEPVDLGTMIRQMLAMWEERAAKRNVRVAFARPRSGTAVVAGEASRLARVLDNLVDNAISFSPPGGLVEIGAARIDDKVLVTVQDEGPGVAEEAREAIFNRFHSIRPEGEDFGRHSGLGLAIAKAIVEGHYGRIWVEPRQDGRSGARFVVSMGASK